MRKKNCRRFSPLGRCFHEVTVSPAEWKGLLDRSYELDLDKGAYYDGRLAAIQFWCGPDNKPLDWPGTITKGCLKYPRDYVGMVAGDRTKFGKYKLHFRIQADTRGEKFPRGSKQRKKLEQGTSQDRQWVLRQFRILRQHVRLMRRNQVAFT